MSEVDAERARRRNGLPGVREASGPLPKRLLRNPWTWVFLVATTLYALGLYYQYWTMTRPIETPKGEVEGLNWPAIRDAAKLAFPTLAFWIVIYALLDRFRPQRPLFWWLAVGWGGAIATACSLEINTWAARQMQIAGTDPATGARAAVYVAPFVEEATKASVLFLIALAYRYRLVSKISGLVLAGLSAAGFAFTENIIYYARAIVYSSVTIGAGDPEQAVNQLVALRGYWLAFGHPLFTSMTGIGLLVALRTHSKVVRVLAPLAGYLAGALTHMAFNTAASLVTDTSTQLVMYFAVVLPLVLGAAIWVLRQLLVESRRHRTRLADLARMGWLTESDAFWLSRERSRIRAAVVSASYGWRTFAATLALQRAATELVYLADAQARGTIDGAGDARAHDLVTRINGLRAEAVIDPRKRRFNLPDVRAAFARLRRWRPRIRWRRLPPNRPPATASVTVGSPAYSPVDPRWGPPNP